MKKCLIAMSGGVDSSVAAQILQEKGYECVGCMMRLCGNEQPEDAKNVAEKLGIEFHLLDAQAEFRRCVMADFAENYEKGRTPNPCVVCNQYLKFGVLLEKATEMGCEKIATGHYAVVEYDEKSSRFLLKKAKDPEKDQSYMLYQLSQDQLSKTVFPLGEMTKTQARELAARKSLSNAHKSDSQDICFVPDGNYAEFLERFTGRKGENGAFIDKNGDVLGTHKGIVHYTVGQRRGLGIAAEHPLYVLKIDAEANRVVLGKNEELFSRDVTAEKVNLIAVENLTDPIRCKAKIRYRHLEQPCQAWMEDGRLRVRFDEPQRAITPGQSLVLYDGDTVIGGGIIV